MSAFFYEERFDGHLKIGRTSGGEVSDDEEKAI